MRTPWIAAFTLLLATIAVAADWKHYETKPFGFSMLVPSGVTVREREWGDGWGGLYAEYEGVKLYGRAKMGVGESDADIERYAVRIIGIPASAWTKIDSGTNTRGFHRYRTFRAMDGPRLVFGAYGVGAKGNYLLYLETTPSDYNAHKADYDKWYESIRLD